MRRQTITTLQAYIVNMQRQISAGSSCETLLRMEIANVQAHIALRLK